jgi:hypothetical protein
MSMSLGTQAPSAASDNAGHRSGAPRQTGIAAVETLLAAPIVLLLGLSVLQWGLLFHGRGAVAHAAQEAARAGSVDHASSDAIERGLARGLAPWLYGASGPEEHAANVARTRAHLSQGKAAGWASWRRLAPTAGSFTDWGETARDADGQPIEGLLEIPNDNLTLRTGMRMPASGVAGYRGAEPIGSVSRQTLSDANLLKVEVVYGVPLTVPLIGRVAAWVMRGIDGCGGGAGAGAGPGGGAGVSMRLGTVDLGVPESSASPRRWACAHYESVGDDGRSRPRWPVRVSATVRMQSPARDADAAPPLETDVTPGPSLGPGEVDPEGAFRPIAPRKQNPGGASPTQDGSHDRAPGFLKLGGDRLTPPPGMCAAS